MKNLLYLLPLMLFACNTSADKPAVSQIKLPPPPKVDVNPLLEKKSHTDSLFKYAYEEEISIYVKQAGIDIPVKVAAKKFPEDIETTYTLFKDNMGRIIRISENTDSDSADYFIGCTHYFDEAGKTFAFERKINSFNSGCTEGVLFETKTEYYNPNFKRIDYTYKLVDENERHMVKDSCQLIAFDANASATVTAYLQSKKIQMNDSIAHAP